MHQIDTGTAVPTMPVPEAQGTPGWFQQGNKALGIKGTQVSASWMNMVQAELRAILTAAGITPLKTNFGQVVQAIQSLISTSSASTLTSAQNFATNSLNAYKATLSSGSNANGTWFDLPAGLIVQVGSSTTNASGVGTITFPKAFPNGCLIVIPQDGATGVANVRAMGTGIVSATTATVYHGEAVAGGFTWLALGS